MSSTAPTKRARPTNTLKTRTGVREWVRPFLSSTVGMKFLVALTGLGLTGFVIVHMLGNLQIFAGQNALNSYAAMLKSNAAVLWTARIGLAVLLLVHLGLALRLRFLSNSARPVKYVHETTIQASFASRQMALTGLVILAFVIFHILHFTAGVVHQAHFPAGTILDNRPKLEKATSVSYMDLEDQKNRHDVYSMVVYGFQTPWIAITYIVAMGFLLVHLLHGIASIFQTLGINTPRMQKAYRLLGAAIAIIVVTGNIAIVASVWSSPFWGGPFQPHHRTPDSIPYVVLPGAPMPEPVKGPAPVPPGKTSGDASKKGKAQ